MRITCITDHNQRLQINIWLCYWEVEPAVNCMSVCLLYKRCNNSRWSQWLLWPYLLLSLGVNMSLPGMIRWEMWGRLAQAASTQQVVIAENNQWKCRLAGKCAPLQFSIVQRRCTDHTNLLYSVFYMGGLGLALHMLIFTHQITFNFTVYCHKLWTEISGNFYRYSYSLSMHLR